MLDPKKCPECDKPNQFGEMCEPCEREFNRIEMCEDKFNQEHDLYEYGE